jgi:hypothetical protein
MKIKLETTYIPLILAYDDLPDGVELVRQPVMERRDIEYTSVAVGILSFASGVSASLVASWIYEKIKKIKDKPDFLIKINEKEVRHVDLDSLTETIEREIQISKR